MAVRKANPANARGGRFLLASKDYGHDACARLTESQSCCQRARSKLPTVAPCPLTVAGGDMPALSSQSWLHFPALLSLPSFPITGAFQLQQHCPRRACNFVCTALNKIPRRAETITTSLLLLAIQGALSPPPASVNTNTWQHMHLQKSCQNSAPSLERQWR